MASLAAAIQGIEEISAELRALEAINKARDMVRATEELQTAKSAYEAEMAAHPRYVFVVNGRIAILEEPGTPASLIEARNAFRAADAKLKALARPATPRRPIPSPSIAGLTSDQIASRCIERERASEHAAGNMYQSGD